MWLRKVCSTGTVAAGLMTLALGSGACRKRSSDQPARRGSGRAGGLLLVDLATQARRWAPPPRAGVRYELEGAPRRYDRRSVFELLDGGADAYLEAGLQSLVHARYRDTSGACEGYEVLIFDLGSAKRARALLAGQRGPKSTDVRLGDAGWQEAGAVEVVRGRYLVKVSAMPMGKKKPAPVREVARLVLGTPGARW